MARRRHQAIARWHHYRRHLQQALVGGVRYPQAASTALKLVPHEHGPVRTRPRRSHSVSKTGERASRDHPIYDDAVCAAQVDEIADGVVQKIAGIAVSWDTCIASAPG